MFQYPLAYLSQRPFRIYAFRWRWFKVKGAVLYSGVVVDVLREQIGLGIGWTDRAVRRQMGAPGRHFLSSGRNVYVDEEKDRSRCFKEVKMKLKPGIHKGTVS